MSPCDGPESVDKRSACSLSLLIFFCCSWRVPEAGRCLFNTVDAVQWVLDGMCRPCPLYPCFGTGWNLEQQLWGGGSEAPKEERQAPRQGSAELFPVFPVSQRLSLVVSASAHVNSRSYSQKPGEHATGMQHSSPTITTCTQTDSQPSSLKFHSTPSSKARPRSPQGGKQGTPRHKDRSVTPAASAIPPNLATHSTQAETAASARPPCQAMMQHTGRGCG